MLAMNTHCLVLAGWLQLVLLSLGTRANPRPFDLTATGGDDDESANEVTTIDDDCEDVSFANDISKSGTRAGEKEEMECVEVQERECGACHSIYVRECSIRMEYSFHPEKVEECVEYPSTAPFSNNSTASSSDCQKGHRRVCRTVYRSECGTKMQYRDMEEDHPLCNVEMTEDCKRKSADKTPPGSSPCRKVPVMRCRIEKRTVRKGQPETTCRRIPEEICQKEKCVPPAVPRRKCFERVRMSRELVPREECGYREKRVCQQTSDSDCRLRKRQECTPKYFVSRRLCKRTRTEKAPAVPAVQQP